MLSIPETLVALVRAVVASDGRNEFSGNWETKDFLCLGLSSVDVMELACQVERTFAVVIPDEFLIDSSKRTLDLWHQFLQQEGRLTNGNS
jgi:acyl carrier protein